jgi:hypothetical protein
MRCAAIRFNGITSTLFWKKNETALRMNPTVHPLVA